MHRWILPVLLLTGAVAAARLPDDRTAADTKTRGSETGRIGNPSYFTSDGPLSPRIVPGVQPDGSIRLHNTWSLKPAGKQIELGDFPVNIAVHPSGEWLAVLHAGYGEHEIVVVDVKGAKQRIVCRAPIQQGFYGLCFAPDGTKLYASAGEQSMVNVFDFNQGYLGNHRGLVLAKDAFAGGIATDPEGKQLAVAGTWGHVVSLLRTDDPVASLVTLKLEPKCYPYTCLFDKPRNRLYVSLWAKAKVAVLDLEPLRIVDYFATEKHPTEMLLSADRKHLYVACANSTKVSVLNADDGKALQTITTSLFANAPAGNTPCSLSMTPDGEILFVANADNNNVAVFNISDPKTAKPLGFIPVGYHPTSVRYNTADKRIYVANARGSTPKSNRQGPNPLLPPNQATREYIAGLYRGTLTTLPMPNEEQMVTLTKQTFACTPLRQDLGVRGDVPKDSPVPASVGDASPIKHCIYIIRENRTYDQVFGDIREGNGDPTLCIFPEKVTPNAHRLAKEFVLLDNFYVEAEVSADGHEWSMGAYCTDFVKKAWPLNYRGSKKVTFPAEGTHDEAARPAGGYLWDRCAEAGVSYRSYGEWITDGKTPKDPATARVKALEGHIDPWYRGFDMDYPDVKRAQRFIEELQGFEKTGDLPQMVILRLPCDHTSGARVGKLTPTAMVADNDFALGMIVEAITKCRFWKETAIFVLEDDAQNGSDHVDAHRSPALVISPYTKRGHVDSTMYSTTSMLRTMELILKLAPMSQYDAAATPIYQSFQAMPDVRPYTHVVPTVDMKAVNTKLAWGAGLSEQMDFTREDAADDLLLNEIIWRSVRGPESPMPPPVRAPFVFPK
jgi:DNA-binding beta-propeller fold protein YncE